MFDRTRAPQGKQTGWAYCHVPHGSAYDATELIERQIDGVLLVVDHVATNDPGFTAPDTLHRIDPAAARAEIQSAGFKFDGSLPILANTADPHTAKVFDPSIRGKTDQFVYRFRKPR